MLFRYDPEADAAYLTLRDRELRAGEAVTQSGFIETPSGKGTIIVDFDAEGRFLGVEILGCRAVLPPELLSE